MERISKATHHVKRYPAVLLFILISTVTTPFYFADTFEYVWSVLAQSRGGAHDFYEFGHLGWRPLGYAMFEVASPLMSLLVGDAASARAAAGFISVVYGLSLLSIYFLYRLLRGLNLGEMAVQLATLLYVVSLALMNYAQTGTSYFAGASLIVVALYFDLRNGAMPKRSDSWLAAIFAAGAVLCWFLFIWALPGLIFARCILFGMTGQFRDALRKTAIMLAIGVTAYGAAIWRLQLTNLDAITMWISGASHNVSGSTLSRVIFGLPKNLFYFAQDNLLVKRLLNHDQLNPVTVVDLLTSGLWKLGLFYVLLAVAVYTCLRRDRRRFVLLFVVGSLPNVIFALTFDGSAYERYIPLFPFLIILIAAFADVSARAWERGLIAFTIAVAASTNFAAMNVWSAESRRREVREEILPIWSELDSNSAIIVLGIHDELVEFQRTNYFDTFNHRGNLNLYSVMNVTGDSGRFWREAYQSRAREAWRSGGNVWVSSKLLASRPSPDWAWVEGAESYNWEEVSTHFNSLDYSKRTSAFLRLDSSAIQQ